MDGSRPVGVLLHVLLERDCEPERLSTLRASMREVLLVRRPVDPKLLHVDELFSANVASVRLLAVHRRVRPLVVLEPVESPERSLTFATLVDGWRVLARVLLAVLAQLAVVLEGLGAVLAAVRLLAGAGVTTRVKAHALQGVVRFVTVRALVTSILYWLTCPPRGSSASR